MFPASKGRGKWKIYHVLLKQGQNTSEFFHILFLKHISRQQRDGDCRKENIYPYYKGNNEYLLKLSDVTMYDTAGVKVELRQWLLDQQYGEHMSEGYISQERAKERAEFEFQDEAMKHYLNNPDRDIYIMCNSNFRPIPLAFGENNVITPEKNLSWFSFLLQFTFHPKFIFQAAILFMTTPPPSTA